jgi:hypothetical protein
MKDVSGHFNIARLNYNADKSTDTRITDQNSSPNKLTGEMFLAILSVIVPHEFSSLVIR